MDNERASNGIFVPVSSSTVFFKNVTVTWRDEAVRNAERTVCKWINWLLGYCVIVVSNTLPHYFAVLSRCTRRRSERYLSDSEFDFVFMSLTCYILSPVSHVKRYRYTFVSRQYHPVSVLFGTITSRNLRNWKHIRVFEINTVTKQTSLRFQPESM